MTQLTLDKAGIDYPIGAQWVADESAAAELVIEWTRADNRLGIIRGFQHYIERLRARGILGDPSKPYAFDHRDRSEVERYLMLKYSLQFRIRKAACDPVGVPNAR